MNIRTRFGHPPNPNPLKRIPHKKKSTKIKPARPPLLYINPFTIIYNSLIKLNKNIKGKQ